MTARVMPCEHALLAADSWRQSSQSESSVSGEIVKLVRSVCLTRIQALQRDNGDSHSHKEKEQLRRYAKKIGQGTFCKP